MLKQDKKTTTTKTHTLYLFKLFLLWEGVIWIEHYNIICDEMLRAMIKLQQLTADNYKANPPDDQLI